MRVLLTGGGGYIGSVLSGELVRHGYSVTVLDRFFFGQEVLAHLEGRVKLVKDDIRWVSPQVFRGVDAVIDMAAMSNDPVGEFDPRITMAINFQGRTRVARLAKKAGAERYVLPSSCSVYGFRESSSTVTEDTTPSPLTTYSRANLLWERKVLPMASRRFCVTVLRQASVYGPSRRTRFDIAFNNMVLTAFKHKRIPVMRDGRQHRPIIHIHDAARAFLTILEADESKINHEVFNVGSNDQNYSIMELAKMAAQGAGVPFKFDWYGLPDYRSYVVNFDKISGALGFRPRRTPIQGARDLCNALQSGKVQDDDRTITLKWYQHLRAMQRLVKDVESRGVIL